MLHNQVFSVLTWTHRLWLQATTNVGCYRLDWHLSREVVLLTDNVTRKLDGAKPIGQIENENFEALNT